MPANITISDRAAARIKQLSTDKGKPGGGLRLGVKGGGCSGLSYFMDWADEPGKLDQVFEKDGGRVFVDPKSAVFLDGTVVEWQQTLMQTGFVFKNPNVKSACGCGESFTVQARVVCWSCGSAVAPGTPFCPSCRKIQPLDTREDHFALLGVPRRYAVDADGILKVSARELATGIEQSIRVKATQGLSEEEVERMLVASIEHAAEDVSERFLREWRVEGDRLLASLESALREDGELLSAAERAAVEERLEGLRGAVQGEDALAIKAWIESTGAAAKEFAERRMDERVGRALAGRRVEDLAEKGPAGPPGGGGA